MGMDNTNISIEDEYVNISNYDLLDDIKEDKKNLKLKKIDNITKSLIDFPTHTLCNNDNLSKSDFFIQSNKKIVKEEYLNNDEFKKLLNSVPKKNYDMELHPKKSDINIKYTQCFNPELEKIDESVDEDSNNYIIEQSTESTDNNSYIIGQSTDNNYSYIAKRQSTYNNYIVGQSTDNNNSYIAKRQSTESTDNSYIIDINIEDDQKKNINKKNMNKKYEQKKYEQKDSLNIEFKCLTTIEKSVNKFINNVSDSFLFYIDNIKQQIDDEDKKYKNDEIDLELGLNEIKSKNIKINKIK